MSLSRLAVLVTTAVIGLGLPSPTAIAAPRPAAQPGDSPSAVAWLQRAAAAPGRVSFRATQVITAWGPQGASSARLDVVHAAQQGSEVTVLGSGASPGLKAFVQRAGHTATPAVDGAPLALLRANYHLVYQGVAPTIGRTAVLIEALRPDRTVAARFWIDQATGLLLQRQLFGTDGRTTVRATRFTELVVDGSEFLSHLPPLLPDAVRPVGPGEVEALRAQGWTCADALPGQLTLYDAHQDTSTGTLQFSYSDGLFAMSLFEQRGDLDPAAVAGYATTSTPSGAQVFVRPGMPSYAVWSSGGIVYTLVGDLPSGVLSQVVAALPHAPPPRITAVEQTGTGLARIARWLTPMGLLSRERG